MQGPLKLGKFTEQHRVFYLRAESLTEYTYNQGRELFKQRQHFCFHVINFFSFIETVRVLSTIREAYTCISQKLII